MLQPPKTNRVACAICKTAKKLSDVDGSDPAGKMVLGLVTKPPYPFSMGPIAQKIVEHTNT